VVASVLDVRAVAHVMEQHRVAGVIHLAGKKSVSESIQRLSYYYEQNVVGVECVLEQCGKLELNAWSTPQPPQFTARPMFTSSRRVIPLGRFRPTATASSQEKIASARLPGRNRYGGRSYDAVDHPEVERSG
jgi:nucleoside-diphosphate-sugar epimerase